MRDAPREDILNPEALWIAIEMAAEQYAGRPGDVAQDRAGLEADLRRVEGELGRRVAALASGDSLASVREAIKTREQRRVDLAAASNISTGWPEGRAWTPRQ